MNITYPVKKVRGNSRRSQVVPFNNLKFYQEGQEERMGGPATGGSVNVPRDEGKNHQWVLPGSSKVESMEPGTVISRADKCRRWGQ